jgi:hypothetical protein
VTSCKKGGRSEWGKRTKSWLGCLVGLLVTERQTKDTACSTCGVEGAL